MFEMWREFGESWYVLLSDNRGRVKCRIVDVAFDLLWECLPGTLWSITGGVEFARYLEIILFVSLIFCS